MSKPSASRSFGDRLRSLIPQRFRSDIDVVPVVRLAGAIGFSTPLRPGLTLASCGRALERAFTTRNARAVALIVNSPGGSPVQSHLIFTRIRQLAAEHEIPALVFIEDVGASGGYMVACAGDEIFCNRSSIIGSIGVVGASFGFDRAIEKLGIERRVYTSGERKVMLDPFLPENAEDVERLKAIQKDIHTDFIALVKARRGDKLRGQESALFSGEYWAGEKALEYGLVDSVGDLRAVLRERYGEKVKMPVIAERGWLSRRLSGETALSDLTLRPGLAEEFVSALEARALWSRFGL